MNVNHDPDRPEAWLARAQSNLLLAETTRQQGLFLEDLCFEAQQAAEKALKAVCVYYEVEFPKTHSLVTLTSLLANAGVQMPPVVRDADMLTFYAVQARYPGWDEAATEAEYERAVAIARQVVSWAATIIGMTPPIQG